MASGIDFFWGFNSGSNITIENHSFSITVPGHWETKIAEKTIDELNELLELRSQNGIELHVAQVRNKDIVLLNDYSLSSLGTFKIELLEDLENVKNNDLDDLVNRFQLTYDEIIVILDLKYIPTKRTGYSLNPRVYEVIAINKTIKYILPDNVKIKITIDDIRLKSNLKINQTIIFTEKSFFMQF